MPKKSSNPKPEPPGFVRGDELYTLDEVKARLGLGEAALRQARRAGLAIRRIGRRSYVLGRDLLAYVESAANGSYDN